MLAYLRRHGVSKTWRYARERLTNPYHERRLGIRTIGKPAPEELGFTDPLAFEYYPADYPTIYKCLRRLKIRPALDGFLDFGCGMGRVVIVAGTYRFRSVIGVELSPLLAEMARANLVRARPKLRCGDARIVTADARTFLVPAEIHHVFLYCPFDVPILRSVFSNIFDSLRQSPRPLTVTFKNPTYFEPLMTEFPWLVKRTEFRACDASHKVMILDARL